MSLLTRDQILTADDLQTKDVYVSQWGGSVRVRTMTAGERDIFEQMIFSGKDKAERRDNVRAAMLALTIVDDQGKRLFSEDHVKRLAGKSAAAVDKVFTEVQRLNAMSDEDVEAIAKNSEGTPGDSTDGE